MNQAAAEEVRERACTSKLSYCRTTARSVAAEQSRLSGLELRAYRCPFHCGTGPAPVWHIGRIPSPESVALLAAAVRFFATGYEGE